MRCTAPVPAVALVLLLAACSGGTEPEAASDPTPSAESTPEAEEEMVEATEEPEPEETEPADDAAAAGGDPCALVAPGKLAAVFGMEVPEGDGANWGEGFVECVWEAEDLQVRVSIVPAANLQTDYVDQLAGSPMAGLDGAVGFAGVVGIGHVSSGGWTTAVPNGEEGLLVGVRSGGATDDDAVAREIIEEILAAG